LLLNSIGNSLNLNQMNMKQIIVIAILWLAGLAACTSKSTNKKTETTSEKEVAIEKVSDLDSELVRIDSLKTELEGSIEKLDEILTELE